MKLFQEQVLYWKLILFLHALIEFGGYFNNPGPEIGYFQNEIGLEVTFGTTLQNRKPQMPSSDNLINQMTNQYIYRLL